MSHTTNYFDTFICIAPDSPAKKGTEPPQRKTPSVAALSFALLKSRPYLITSDELVFQVYAKRKGIGRDRRKQARDEYFSKAQPCLRCSDLPKKYGWGIHFDERGRVALYGVESNAYREFVAGRRLGKGGKAITIKKAMRSKR